MTRLRVKTGSRLHFGLLGWGDHAPRQFGGVGLMIEDPGIEVVAERADRWFATGPLGERALEIALRIARVYEDRGFGPFRLTNLQVPEAHVGLGVGTQLSLAVVRALSRLAGQQLGTAALARLTERGRRSGIGLHGFAEGGLIVDAGRRRDDQVPTRLVRYPFPEDWSILVVIPPQPGGIHGEREIEAFRALPPMPDAASDRLCRLVLLGLLPSLLETDLETFGAALVEIQRIVGEAFAPAQGGRFRGPEVEAAADAMHRQGLLGVGQSSWGPTLYGFTTSDEAWRADARARLIDRLGIDPGRIFWTRALNRGASVAET